MTARNVNLVIRVTPEERERLHAAAAAERRALSEVLRAMALRWAARVERRAEKR